MFENFIMPMDLLVSKIHESNLQIVQVACFEVAICAGGQIIQTMPLIHYAPVVHCALMKLIMLVIKCL